MSQIRPGGRAEWTAAHRESFPSGEVDDAAARDLFLRGRAVEEAGDPAAALNLYADALAASGSGWHPADTGAVLRRVGGCASRLGDVPSAWDAHLAAARLIHGHHALGDLAAVLGDAGHLLVECHPATPIRDAITHDLLLDAVADGLDLASGALLGDPIPSIGTAMDIHRKLTGLMLLATGAASDVILSQGALALYHRVARPLAERHVPSREVDDRTIVAVAFDALARLYEALGEQERPRRATRPPTFEEVRSLACLTTMAFAAAPRPRISRWLGPYLRERRGAVWATDDVLADIRSAA